MRKDSDPLILHLYNVPKIFLLTGDFSPLVRCSTLTFQGIVKPRNYQFSDLIKEVPAEAAFEKVSGAGNNRVKSSPQLPIHLCAHR
jgi:hypothetical protein